MERERHGDRIVVGRRVRPDLLVFADVVFLFYCTGHQWPERFDLVAADVEESRSDRRHEPLVQTRAVIVAAQLIAREWEVRERVRTVNEHLDPLWPREVHDLAHGRDVARHEADVHRFYNFCARRNCAGNLLDVVLGGPWRRLELHPFDGDSVATLALL